MSDKPINPWLFDTIQLVRKAVCHQDADMADVIEARLRAQFAASPAPAIPADDCALVPRGLLASLVDDVEEYAGRHNFRERERETRAREIASARAILAAPAISESDVLIVPARVGELIDSIKRDGLLKRAAEFSEMCRLIDDARKGEKS
ncbi:hypothetical protein [Burkholderia gladioli]|uniref:hypothetical protein n=1 Tax=Burkholderia gladioli TaxID=28095 RepID=UPI001640D821|nr:hypothetical protein [Burkholderia gladioli]